MFLDISVSFGLCSTLRGTNLFDVILLASRTACLLETELWAFTLLSWSPLKFFISGNYDSSIWEPAFEKDKTLDVEALPPPL